MNIFKNQSLIKLKKIFMLISFLFIISLLGCNNNSSTGDVATTNEPTKVKINLNGTEIIPPIVEIISDDQNIKFKFELKLSNDIKQLLLSAQNEYDINNYVLLLFTDSEPYFLDNSEFESQKWDLDLVPGEYIKINYPFEFIFPRTTIEPNTLINIDQVLRGEKKYCDVKILFYNSNEELFHVIHALGTLKSDG